VKNEVEIIIIKKGEAIKIKVFFSYTLNLNHNNSSEI